MTPFRASLDTHGGNTDLKLELLDSTGTVVAIDDPSSTQSASLTYVAALANYHARVLGSSAGTPLANPPTGYTVYGSGEQYTLTGTIIASVPRIVSAAMASVAADSAFEYAIVATNGHSSFDATGLPTRLTIDPGMGVINGRSTQTGVFPILLSATNSLGTGTARLTLTIADAAPAIVSQPTGLINVVPGATQTLDVTALSGNGEPTYQQQRIGRNVDGATGASLTLAAFLAADAGYYRVRVTNTIGTTTGAAAFVRCAPQIATMLGWDDAAKDGTAVPGVVVDANQVAMGYEYGLAVRPDGAVAAWGGLTGPVTRRCQRA